MGRDPLDAWEIKRALQKRYPALSIVSVERSIIGQEFQQRIRLQGTLPALRRCGLLTPSMIRQGSGPTPIGDHFFLTRGIDSLSKAGLWDLFLLTGQTPREKKKLKLARDMKEARSIIAECLK